MAPAPAPLRILGDWGTSNLRLWLCRGDDVIDRRDGPGLAPLKADGGSPAAAFTDLAGAWSIEHGRLPAILCGMVGANIGWMPAPYVECPARLIDLAGRLTRIETAIGPVAIVAGLAGINILGGPDVMRGEETQIFGALSIGADRRRGHDLICLPGTHSKWAEIRDGTIIGFQTALTGELFALVQRHSILLGGGGMEPGPAGFDEGVIRIRDCGGDALFGLLFETRSRQLRAGMAPGDAAGFLSGLLIGAEIAGMEKRGPGAGSGSIILVGSPALTARYARALGHFGASATIIDGDDAVQAGLRLIADITEQTA